jgi:hypothetical protein
MLEYSIVECHAIEKCAAFQSRRSEEERFVENLLEDSW